MKNNKFLLIFVILAIVSVGLFFGIKGLIIQRNPVETIDHDEHEETADHEGHGHNEDIVSLTDEALELAGIKSDIAKIGRINKIIEFPGEIGFNEDKVVHITPRFGGVASKVLKKLGDYVNKNEELAIVESNESMSSYTLRAPMSGWIIEKHISNGEFVGEEESIYVIANLSDVWVNLSVYPKDAEYIRLKQKVKLECIGKDIKAEGVISYISRSYSDDTRRLTARVVLHNPEGKWNPGMFVKAIIAVESAEDKVVVVNNAIQIVNQKPAVFVVVSKNEFEPVNVVVGERGEELVEIISTEIKPGDRYVSEGAFEIKAHLVTSSLGAHAGHGH